MNLLDLNPNTYKPTFRYKGKAMAINAEAIVKFEFPVGGSITIYQDEVAQSLVNKAGEEVCQKEGLKLFSNGTDYKKYSEDFRHYIQWAYDNAVKKYQNIPDKITKEEWLGVLRLSFRFCEFYKFTEFSYHDLAYKKMLETDDPILKNNLDDLGKLKLEGRGLLNHINQTGGVGPNVLTRISRDFLKNEDDAYFLFSEEIAALFDGYKPTEDFMEQRRSRYGVGQIDGKTIIFSDSEVKKLAELFLKFSKIKELKGVTANKGIASGRVTVVPMMMDKVAIKKAADEMRKGDILVAHSTTPDLIPLCNKAAAIVTDQGGMLSHAAVVSRELNIPCVVGTEVATEVLRNGDQVKVDADKGTVLILNNS